MRSNGLLLALALLLSSCAGKSAAPYLPPVVTPDVRHVVAAIRFSPTKLALFGTGAASARTVVASEKGYGGLFTVSNTCANVATVTPAKGAGPNLKIKVTPKAKGTCSIVVADAAKHKATLPVRAALGGHLVSAFFVPLHIGRAKHHGKQPRFISPSTQAMVVAISGPTMVTLISGMTATSPGCSLTLQGLVCNFGAGLAPCPASADECYTATVTAYDAFDPTTNTVPDDAAPLSVSTSTFGIDANQSTTVTFPFSGIPAQITAVPASALSLATGNVIDLVGPGSHALLAEAFDADHNLIAGIGSPVYSVAVTGALGSTATQPPYGSPRFTVTPPTQLDLQHNDTLTVTAKFPGGATDACAFPGAVCEGAIALDMQSLLAVDSAYSIALFAAEKGAGPLTTITSGIGNTANDVKFDAHGTLYAATPSNGVLEFPLGATIATKAIKTGIAFPVALGFDAAGDLFVLNQGNNTVTRYAPGATTPSKTTNVVANGTALTVDANGDFWVLTHPQGSGQPTSGGIEYYAAAGSSPQALTGLVNPSGMTIGFRGNLYVSDQDYQIPSQSDQCGAPVGSPPSYHYCTLYAYTVGATSPSVVNASAYCGGLAYAPAISGKFLGGLFQDNACGTDLAVYGSNGGFYAQFDGGLAAGNNWAIVVDQLGNSFVSAPFNHSVYEFNYREVQFAHVAPSVTITNGLDVPTNLAIVQ